MMKTSMHRESEQEVDIISTLPDSIVTHIMEFLVTKEAVHTSILSKRWKHLWKSLAILIINSNQFDKAEFFKKFVLKVLQHRDYSSALRKIVVKHNGHIHFHILAKIINYAVSYEVEQFKLDTFLRNDVRNMLLFHPLFYLRSLKRLDVSLRKSGWIAQLPHNLDFIGEANIDVLCHSSIPGVEETLKNWFRRISNVHSLSLCLQTLEGLSHIPDFPYIESMGFSKLKSVIVRRFAETVPLPKGVLDYLLQDSPLAECRIIQATSCGRSNRGHFYQTYA
ncbi:F-box family protein [Trifolium pratense]|uniref:F-box family protein n=1 Tax=Trifolium pratense TaxID=57577 RepID=A0A2K3P809_TRIPR|nr:F-box family protein [Trifolium pratense]